MLQGDKAPASAEIPGESFLRSQVIIWSQRFNCVVIPTVFDQLATLPQGGTMSLSGDALSVDRNFRRWTFYSAPGKPIRLEFKPQPPVETTP